MSFNPHASKHAQEGRKTKKVHHSPLICNISAVTHTIFGSNFPFTNHLNSVLSKINKITERLQSFKRLYQDLH